MGRNHAVGQENTGGNLIKIGRNGKAVEHAVQQKIFKRVRFPRFCDQVVFQKGFDGALLEYSAEACFPYRVKCLEGCM